MKLHHILILSCALLIAACSNNKSSDNGGLNITVSPDAGTTYNAGRDVTIQAHYDTDVKPDSVVYLIDSVRLAVKKDSSAVTLKTDTLKMGVKSITVKVYQGGKSDQASTNVVILAAKAPQELTYKVVKPFPHDTSSFTEGLEYHNGFLYESDGGYADSAEGRSSLRKVDIRTGKVLQSVLVDPKVFAEGITIIDDKIIQLTYHEKIGYVYDLKSMKLLSTFTFNAASQGWGLCSDGKYLYATVGEGETGTNQIIVLDKKTYQAIRKIDVYDDKGAVSNLNELELINGKFFSNVWGTDKIVIIDPKTGAVEQWLDMSKLYPNRKQFNPNADVLNGIAWDAQGKRLFVTGKKWDRLFQIKVPGVN